MSQKDNMKKYHKNLVINCPACGISGYAEIDVYEVLAVFKVHNPATAHAIKKLLMPGTRGYKNTIQDMEEAIVSINRAIELQREYGNE